MVTRRPTTREIHDAVDRLDDGDGVRVTELYRELNPDYTLGITADLVEKLVENGTLHSDGDRIETAPEVLPHE